MKFAIFYLSVIKLGKREDIKEYRPTRKKTL